MEILDQANIHRTGEKISISLFRDYISNQPELVEAGEHHIFCDLTGDPVFKTGIGMVYFVSQNQEPSYIEHQEDRISLNNIPCLLAKRIASDLNAILTPVYMHG